MSDQNKVTPLRRYNRYSWLNIGTLLFGAIFIYIIICTFLYMTTRHEASYEVTEGTISGNYRYTALALKSEEVVIADYSGYVTYYARNNGKTAKDGKICAIDEYASAAQTSGDGTVSDTGGLTLEERQSMRSLCSAFTGSFTRSSFQSVYNFKADVQALLAESNEYISASVGLKNLVVAPSAGFVAYVLDGMEGITEDEISDHSFSRTEYRVRNMRVENDYVKAGDPLFKIVSGDSWYLYFPLSKDLLTRLQDRTAIRFRFMKDDTTFSAPFGIVENKNGVFGKISLNTSLVRYVSDRYLEIELLMDGKKGLKIPTSAVTEQIFYNIPEDYVIINPDNSGEVTFLRETYRRNGESIVSYVTAPVYAKQNGGYLVDTSLFNEGDYVQMPDTSKKHKITKNNLYTIQGVYNINQGYAQFRQVTVIDENEEFCIVEPYNLYGLAAHDFIVLDASRVKSGDII